MKVILLKDVKKLGKKNDIVEVNNGYANNYLIPNKLAVMLTKTSLGIKKEEEEKQKKVLENKKKEALQIKEKLTKIEVIIKIKTGQEGKTFGTVSTKMIADELNSTHNIIIDRRKFIDFKNLNQLGSYQIKIELFKGVIGEIRLTIIEE